MSAKECFGNLTEQFWADLEPTQEFHDILRAVFARFPVKDVSVLTAGDGTEGCNIGKIRWIHKYLPMLTHQICIHKEKELVGGFGRLLIDDKNENVQTWEATGGEAFLFPRPWNNARKHEPKAVELLQERLDRHLQTYPSRYLLTKSRTVI